MNENKIELKDDFKEEKGVLMSFNLQGNHEKEKLRAISKSHSLDMSSMIRQLILREWKRLQNGSADV